MLSCSGTINNIMHWLFIPIVTCTYCKIDRCTYFRKLFRVILKHGKCVLINCSYCVLLVIY